MNHQMTSDQAAWEYCTIRLQMRYKGEDPTRGGYKVMWVVFQARISGSEGSSLVKESTEIPLPANIVGASLSPQENNPTHLNIHQNLVQALQAEGWERLPDQSGTWWERRFRRVARPKEPSFLTKVFEKLKGDKQTRN